MTDHAGTVDAPYYQRLKMHPSHIGREQSAQGTPCIGSRQAIREEGARKRPGLGFGADASAEFADAFIKAMVEVEFRPRIDPKIVAAHQNGICATWTAIINSTISHAPSDVVRRDRGIVVDAEGNPFQENDGDMKKGKVYRERLIPIYEYLHAEYVHRFDDLLIPQLVPEEYSLNHIMADAPKVTPDGSVHNKPGWRYQVMAGLLWYELGPNLRTMEMADPNAVWRNLFQYFRQVHELYGHWPNMSDSTRRRERGSFILALYERTMALFHERWHEAKRYQLTISQRPSAVDDDLDPVLFIPPGKGRPDVSLAEARQAREVAYDHLLLATLGNCHAALRLL